MRFGQVKLYLAPMACPNHNQKKVNTFRAIHQGDGGGRAFYTFELVLKCHAIASGGYPILVNNGVS